MRWSRPAILVLAGCLLVVPAQASAQSKLFQDYRKNGTINPCDYSPGELKKGLSGLPPDVQAYVPGLSDQLRRGCGGGGGGQVTPEQRAAVVPAPGSPPSSPSAQRKETVPRPPGPRPDAQNVVAGTAPSVPDGPLPDIPAWLAALLAAAAAGGVSALLAVRYGALDPSGIARSVRAVLARR